jgi:tRNA(fMet)-specific endonuclease VapC
MYILDTDHISLIQRNGQAGKRILTRLEAVAESEVSVTVITYEEQVKGRLGYLAKSKTLDDQVAAYQGLRQLAMDYRLITTILPFDRPSALEFERLRKAYPRLGQMDLKIAAIALMNDATLLTCNQSDFAQVVGLLIEDWAIAQ